VVRRPGTKHVAEVKTSAKATRVIAFEFSTTQAYIIEVGDQYMRFYRDNGQIVSGMSAYEISTPYLEADIFDLQFTQSADVLFIVHPDYAPRELTRTGHTSWTLSETDFQDGPYLALNGTSTTLTASAMTGSVTVTASATTGINGGDGFKSTDVGRVLRIEDNGGGGKWAWGEITGFTSTTVVTVEVKENNFPTTGTTIWRLGAWSDTDGWPGTVTFYQDRLFYGGTTNYPQRVDGSRTGDYNNFAPSDLADGTVADDHAVSYTLNANNVNRTRWMLDQDKGLAIGTTGGEWLLRPSNRNEAISPTNVKADRATPHGSSKARPLRAGPGLLYIQRAGRKVREMVYSIDVDNYAAADVTKLAEHITKGGLVELAYQQEPYSIVWAVRNDGTLLGFTYDRTEDVLGWHRHIVGGVSDANGTQAQVESVAVIPSADGSYDELWLVVKRYIDGSTVRYVEYMVAYWDDETAQEDAFFVDSGLTYDGAAATTISGLDHLEGETVAVLADGAVHPSKTVASGQITLDYAASKVHAGLSYDSDLETLSIESGAADGTAVGKTKRIHRVIVKLLNTLGLKTGASSSDLTEYTFRKTSDPLGSAPPLFSGDIELPWEGGYATQARVYLRQTDPLPGTIVAVMPQMLTMDR